MLTIAVDLMPIWSNGGNGGAKVITLDVLKALAILKKNWTFLLVCTFDNQVELQCFFKDINNVQFFTVALKDCDPTFLIEKKVDLIFSPFTHASLFYDIGIAFVSVIHDIQHFVFPDFFTTMQHADRCRQFAFMQKYATQLIVCSAFVQESLTKKGENIFSSERVSLIPIQNALRLITRDNTEKEQALSHFNLKKHQFIFYPANFWPHKNHGKLIQAWDTFCAQYPQYAFHLVLSGELDEAGLCLKDKVEKNHGTKNIIFTGFLSNELFGTLMKCCRFLIFPSLYEGFGMPILEAMAMETLVVSSDAGSLPEIAGDAAIFFDAKNEKSILDAIVQAVHLDPQACLQYKEKGLKRVQAFSSMENMGQEYAQLFETTIQTFVPPRAFIRGLYQDGWAKNYFYLMVRQTTTAMFKRCVLNFSSPFAYEKTEIQIHYLDENNVTQVLDTIISPQKNEEIKLNISSKAQKIMVYLTPLQILSNVDPRAVSCFFSKGVLYDTHDQAHDIHLLESPALCFMRKAGVEMKI